MPEDMPNGPGLACHVLAQDEGYALLCVAYPVSDCSIRVIPEVRPVLLPVLPSLAAPCRQGHATLLPACALL